MFCSHLGSTNYPMTSLNEFSTENFSAFQCDDIEHINQSNVTVVKFKILFIDMFARYSNILNNCRSRLYFYHSTFNYQNKTNLTFLLKSTIKDLYELNIP